MNTKPQSEVVSAAIRDILANRRRLSPLADEIGSRIVAGDLKEGAPLSERMFSASRAVSRTSFREAIKVLEGKGLVRARQNTGTVVAPRGNWQMLDPELLAWRIACGGIDGFIYDFFLFRRSVEPPAAESAARRGDLAMIAEIRAAFDRMKTLETDDPFGPRYVAADVQFHQAIFRASANEFLMAMGNILEVPLLLSFTLHSNLKVGPTNRLALHEIVVKEIEGGNGPGAYTASLALLSDVSHDVHRIIDVPNDGAIPHSRVNI